MWRWRLREGQGEAESDLGPLFYAILEALLHGKGALSSPLGLNHSREALLLCLCLPQSSPNPANVCHREILEQVCYYIDGKILIGWIFQGTWDPPPLGLSLKVSCRHPDEPRDTRELKLHFEIQSSSVWVALIWDHF